MQSEYDKHQDYLKTLWERIKYVKLPEVKFPASSIVLLKKEVYDFIRDIYPNIKLFNYRIVENESNWNYVSMMKHIDTVFVIGGGKLIDAVRYVANEVEIKVITIPSSLQTHMYISPKVHVPEEPVAKTVGFPTTYIDRHMLEKLYNREPRKILDGFGDLMAVISARKDLPKTDSFVSQQADWLITSLENIDIEKPFSEWIDHYISMQAMLVHLSVWEPAIVSGSEHCFANASNTITHSHLVGLGVRLALNLRRESDEHVVKLLKKFGLPTTLDEAGLPLKEAAKMCKEAEKIALAKKRNTVFKKRRSVDTYKSLLREVFK